MTERAACGLCCTRVSGLSVTLGGRRVLSDIDLHVHCGEITAIIGPNGAGKTTLLRALLGQIPHEGRIDFLRADDSPTHSPRIGYVPQRLDFDRRSPVSVLDLFAMSRSARPAFFGASAEVRREAEAALQFCGAGAVLHRPLGALSGGELQRVLLSLALTPTPDLLLLDEPVAGVDNAGLALFYGVLDQARRRRDLTIVLVTHDLASLPRAADRVILLRDGRVALAGPPEHVAASPDYRACFPAAEQRPALAVRRARPRAGEGR